VCSVLGIVVGPSTEGRRLAVWPVVVEEGKKVGRRKRRRVFIEDRR